MYEVSPKAQKARRESAGRQRAYWPTLSRFGNEMILARPRKFRILTESREEFFEKLGKARAYFAELVEKELPTFTFYPNQRVWDQKQLGAWKAPLTKENYEAVKQMCDHYREILLNLSGRIEEWLKEAQNARE